MKNIIKHVILFIILLFSFTLFFTVKWLYKTFGILTLEEIIFQLKVPMEGANSDFFFKYAINALPFILIFTIATFILLCYVFRKKEYKKPKAKRMKGSHADPGTSLVVYKKFRINTRFLRKVLCSLVILAISISYAAMKTNLIEFIQYQISDSDLIEKEYVDTTKVNLEFPEQKRNLIYIYLESMETTFFSKENGGAYDESIIPELEQLATENISFSGPDELAGLYCLPGTTWTVGAMVAQTAGIPLKIPIDGNSYDKYDSFLPGVTSLGQILQTQDYNQMLMVGSRAEFGGRKNFFEQHGGYEIFDFNTAIAEGRKTEEDFIWWGFSDKDLYEYAKEKITNLSNEEQPFNFTMLTVNTHHIDGFVDDGFEYRFEEPYYNSLACTSEQIKDFVEWIQNQDFYENTTIVLCGDHPSMQPDTFEYLKDEGYIRTVYNTIINSPIEATNTKDKYASTMDMFPTTLASLGVKIDGDKLGLGTNLFSEKETFIKRYGIDFLKKELNKKSKFYNKKFIYDKK